MNKLFKIIIISCILVFVFSASGSFIYYYTYFKPHNEEAKWKAELEWEKEKGSKELAEKYTEKLEARAKEEALYNCLDDAYRLYKEQWDKECKLLDLEPGSPLPKYKADDLEEYYKDLKEECFRLYGSD